MKIIQIIKPLIANWANQLKARGATQTRLGILSNVELSAEAKIAIFFSPIIHLQLSICYHPLKPDSMQQWKLYIFPLTTQLWLKIRIKVVTLRYGLRGWLARWWRENFPHRITTRDSRWGKGQRSSMRVGDRKFNTNSFNSIISAVVIGTVYMLSQQIVIFQNK